MTVGTTRRVLLVGGGRIGSAMLKGWLESGEVERVVVVDPSSTPDDLADHPAVTWVADAAALPADFAPQVAILAVKPQVMGAVLPGYRHLVSDSLVFLSVAAGMTVAGLTAMLTPEARVVRAMPNTPAAIGRGMTVGVPGPGVSGDQRDACDRLLSAVGRVAWIEDESLMDAVTAVSGSGPAYAFLLAEVMAEAGVAAGLPAELAATLARATVSGAGALMDASDEPADQLRRNVTSPGGTTAAALAVLMADDGMGRLMERAIAAAAARSRELAG